MRTKGFTLLEVMITIAVSSVIASIFLPLITWLIAKSSYTSYRSRAGSILQEDIEIAYNIYLADWDEGFSKYGAGLNFHPIINMGMWGLASGEDVGYEGMYTRKIQIAKICRDTNDKYNWAEAAGDCTGNWILDKNSKLIKTEVRWSEQGKENKETAQLLITKI